MQAMQPRAELVLPEELQKKLDSLSLQDFADKLHVFVKEGDTQVIKMLFLCLHLRNLAFEQIQTIIETKNYDDTALFWAVVYGHCEIVEILLATGAKIYNKIMTYARVSDYTKGSKLEALLTTELLKRSSLRNENRTYAH